MYGSMHILKSIIFICFYNQEFVGTISDTVKILIPTHRACLAANITFVVDCDPKICQICCFYHKVHSWSLSSPTTATRKRKRRKEESCHDGQWRI